MGIFFKDYFLIIFMLVGFSFAGGFAVIPFRNTIKYALFISPLTGLLLVALGTSAIYSLLTVSLVTSALIAFVLCVITTSVALLCSPSLFKGVDRWLFVLIALLIAVITYATNYTSITLGQPGLLFMDGTDHLGYAQLADWLNSHFASDQPVAAADVPYQSWPEYMFQHDPRFGSLFILGIISTLQGYSGMFGYDSACAVVLISGFLAVSAIFARSPFTFALLIFGLFTSMWYDYSRSGYFGKILGYPASLLCVGLFFQAARPFTPIAIAILVALVSATTTMHSGLSTILFLVVLAGTFLVVHFVYTKRTYPKTNLLSMKDDFVVFISLIGVAVATMGILARPNHTGVASLKGTWYSLLPRLFDLENLTDAPRYSHLGADVLFIGFVISVLIAITFLIVSIKKRDAIATSLIAGPFLLLLMLIAKDQKWSAYQLIGTFYPFFLCAAIRIMDDFSSNIKENKIIFKTMFILLLVAISIHLPRVMGALHHYASSHTPREFQFSKVEIDKLVDLMGSTKTTINITNPQKAIVLLVELGRRQNLSLHWTPAAWKTIVGYRPSWVIPKLDNTSRYWIDANDATLPIRKNCKVMYTTTQYRLFDCRNNAVTTKHVRNNKR